MSYFGSAGGAEGGNESSGAAAEGDGASGASAGSGLTD
jgi:hypothetical protein